MNSKVKQALRKGAGVSDISAGLAYSVNENAIHKVLKVTDPDVFGKHILVQGRQLSATRPCTRRWRKSPDQAICPDIAELMGAYGAALLARDAWHTEGAARRAAPSTFTGLQNLEWSGDLIKALQSGADPREVAAGISQTGGQCRDSCYLTLHGTDTRRVRTGAILSPASFTLNEQPGANINYPEFIYKILLTVTY